jgi:uncharacterized protein YjbI with pentapeptide repeats
MTDFLCHVKENLHGDRRDRWRRACEGPVVYVHEDERYCVLHLPRQDEQRSFGQAVESKLARRDFDFRGAYFPESIRRFQGYEFDGDANFAGATFSGEANFRRAVFKQEADFSESIFRGRARFRKATFEHMADFSRAIFEQEANFRRATFKGFVEFKGPSDEHPCKAYTFNKRANFSSAKFEERATFVGPCTFDTQQEEATFRDALIEKPENFSLDRVRLRPSWFIDTNVRRLRFTYVKWRGLPGGPKGSIDEEIGAIGIRRKNDRNIGYPADVLARACRELSANAEENRDYPTANEFHYWSMDVLREERLDYLIGIRRLRKNWRRVKRRCGLPTALRWAWRVISRRRLRRPRSRFGLINTLYWALSGYGVRPRRALLVLMGMGVVFAVLYMLFGPDRLQGFWQAVVYSLGVMARLNPHPRPEAWGLFQILVILEGILGPLQAALLALALRRKVMR